MVDPHQRPADRVLLLAVKLSDQHGVGNPRRSTLGGTRNSRVFINSSRMAGSSVIARTAAIIIEKFFVKASGLNRRPSWYCSAKIGMKETAITSSEKKLGPPDLLHRFDDHVRSRAGTAFGLPMLQLLVCLLDHDNGGVHHRADGDGDPARAT